MTVDNSPADQDAISARLRRFPTLSDSDIATLAATLDPVVVDEVSDAVLAVMISGTLPVLPLNPDGGLPLGLTGAVQPTRFVGGTTSGAPTTGAFLVGDFVIARDGHLFICTVAGSPGTWVQSGGAGAAQVAFTAVKTANYTAAAGEVVLCNTTGGTFAVTLPNIATNSFVRVKWRSGTVAPTVVAGSSATLDSVWPGFGAVGDSADFAYDGAMWNYL